MHFTEMIRFWAQSDPERTALIQSDKVVTYRELAEAIESVSQRVVQYNFNREEPVAVSIYLPIQTVAVCFALLRHGLSVAPINHSVLPHLRACGINNLVYTGEGLMLSGGRNIRFDETWFKRSGKSPAIKSPDQPRSEDADTIFLTPSSTGALRKMRVPTGAHMAAIDMLPLSGEENYRRTLVVSGVNTPLGFGHALSSLYAGKTACFAAESEARLLLIGMFNIEEIKCSAQQASELVNHVKKNGKYQLESLKQVWIDRGHVRLDLVREIRAHLCRDVVVSHGFDEAGRIAYANYDRIADVPDAVGFIAPNVRVEIVDNNDMPLGPRKQGRLRCHSEYYAKLLAANKREQAKDADDVWFYSGDRGSMTEDGVLCISGGERDSLR
jgi:2,3-dihydroxybenzoate-AMP ligase